MKDNNDKKEKQKINPNTSQKKVPAENETDTAPDEFIGPNADTDQPIEGQVLNDAVLRGEPNSHDDFPDRSADKDDQQPPKMNDGK